MQTIKYVHWQDGNEWLGYLEDYPDYWTQGETLDDLLDHLKDLFADLSGGQIPGARNDIVRRVITSLAPGPWI